MIRGETMDKTAVLFGQGFRKCEYVMPGGVRQGAARNIQRFTGQRIEPTQIGRIQKRQFVIPHYGWDFAAANQRHDLFRIGPVTDVVTQADDCFNTSLLNIGQHLFECFQVAVYVRYNRELHDDAFV